MQHGHPVALELLGPAGWFYRLAPAGVMNVWPCGPHWSWLRMSRGKEALLVHGNAVDIIARCEALLAGPAVRKETPHDKSR